MSGCITTDADLAAGGIPLTDYECPVCLNKENCVGGWIGPYCPVCKTTIGDEDWRGSIVRRRREYLKLSPYEMARACNTVLSVVKKSERRVCLDDYFVASKKAVQEHNSKEKQRKGGDERWLKNTK